ncbi:hypothetical protein OQA88_9810 [Cercophora sp. LCS_1]
MPLDAATQLQNSLRTQSGPVPSLAWLRAVVPPRPIPLAPLIATARTRLLAADLTSPGLLDPVYAEHHRLPRQAINNPEIDTFRIEQDVVVQIIDIESISRSRWEQVEEMEAIERGEQTRGREVIRLPVGEDGDENQNGDGMQPSAATTAATVVTGIAKNATHKLVVQDCKGTKVYAIELARLDWLAIGTTRIGEKMLLKRDTQIARGVLMLEPENCTLLGGRVEQWHKSWVESRLARLKAGTGT